MGELGSERCTRCIQPCVPNSRCKRHETFQSGGHDEFGIGSLPGFCVGLREMHLIVVIVYDKNDPVKRKATNDCL